MFNIERLRAHQSSITFFLYTMHRELSRVGDLIDILAEAVRASQYDSGLPDHCIFEAKSSLV